MGSKTDATLDIVKLIEKSVITRALSQDYQSDLIKKIKSKLSDKEQQIFSCYYFCHLNYNKDDFTIDLNNIWKYLGYDRRNQAITAIKKYFVDTIDYKIVADEEKTKSTILLTIGAYKKLC